MVTIRFKNYKKDGTQVTSDWTFEPLNDREGEFYVRDEGKDAGAKPLRNPYLEQDIRKIKISAGFLQIPEHKANFKNLLRAIDGRVWFAETKGFKTIWKAFIADLPEEIEYEFFEDLDPMIRYEIKFIEEDGRDFTTWLDE